MVDHRLVRTVSQPTPTEHPCTAPPVNAVHPRYAVSNMPRLLTARSGQLGPERSACVSDRVFDSRRVFDLLLMLVRAWIVAERSTRIDAGARAEIFPRAIERQRRELRLARPLDFAIGQTAWCSDRHRLELHLRVDLEVDGGDDGFLERGRRHDRTVPA